MAVEVTKFVWVVPTGGYRWQQVEACLESGNQRVLRGAERWVLVEAEGDGSPASCKEYEPLTVVPELFRTFADLDVLDRGAIGRFADNYGALGIAKPYFAEFLSGLGTVTPWLGESHLDWVTQIFLLSQAVALFDLLAHRRSKLTRHVRWWPRPRVRAKRGRNQEGWYYDSHPDLPEDEAVFPGRIRCLICATEDLPSGRGRRRLRHFSSSGGSTRGSKLMLTSASSMTTNAGGQ